MPKWLTWKTNSRNIVLKCLESVWNLEHFNSKEVHSWWLDVCRDGEKKNHVTKWFSLTGVTLATESKKWNIVLEAKICRKGS